MPPPRSPARPPIHKRLSVILENGGDSSPPASPPRVFHRPFSRRFYLGDPPRHLKVERWSAPYNSLGGGAAAEDRESDKEKLYNVKNRKFVARRGGWKRLLFIALVALILIAALAVGLAVGLRRRSRNETVTDPAAAAPSSTSASSPRFSGPFPAGSYTFNTYLDVVDTSCVANPATFRCYPYQTYNESRLLSASNFNWIISSPSPSDSSSASDNRGDFTISSTDNPFSLNFESIPLRLLDAGTPEERYEYRVPMDKVVVPSSPITDDNSVASCFFNGTSFHAQLYTKKLKTSSPPGSSSSSTQQQQPPPASRQQSNPNADDFRPWPYAVRIEQSIQSGDRIPTCYKTKDGRLGEQLPVSPRTAPGKGICRCLYRNPID